MKHTKNKPKIKKVPKHIKDRKLCVYSLISVGNSKDKKTGKAKVKLVKLRNKKLHKNLFVNYLPYKEFMSLMKSLFPASLKFDGR